MNDPQPLPDLFCVCDPTGHLVHTTVAIDEKSSIEEWLETEKCMQWIYNLGRRHRGESEACLSSWEGYEAQGYRVVTVELIPVKCHAEHI